MSGPMQQVRFVRSIAGRRPADLEPRPEIAFAGRSNAGKSSLINYISGQKRLAYTGKQPGKTRLINYFDVDGRFYLVDLPGYGYARASHGEIESWGQMMETFFAQQGQLQGIVICLDIRRDPSPEDLQMIRWAQYYGIPFIIAATKADKVAKSKRANEAARIRRQIRAEFEDADPVVVPVSAQDRIGADDLGEQMERVLQAAAAD